MNCASVLVVPPFDALADLDGPMVVAPVAPKPKRGRPPLPRKIRQSALYLFEEQWDALVMRAEADDKTISAVIREILDRELKLGADGGRSSQH